MCFISTTPFIHFLMFSTFDFFFNQKQNSEKLLMSSALEALSWALTDISFEKIVIYCRCLLRFSHLLFNSAVYKEFQEKNKGHKKVICRDFFFLWYYCYWERGERERAVHSSTAEAERGSDFNSVDRTWYHSFRPQKLVSCAIIYTAKKKRKRTK